MATTASVEPLPTINTIPSAPSTIGQDGKEGDFTTQGALSSVTARPTNNIVNTNSFYDVVFLTASSGAIKKIQVTLPAGTTVPSSASFNEAQGIGVGTVSKSGQTLTYTVTNAVNIHASTKIRLEFSNINNPLNPSANYKVTVTTRNAANTIIDGPTQSTAYTMKQVGVNAIADKSITSTKPAKSFMKRVTVFDDAVGHAVGWDPDGVDVSFQISEPAVSGRDTTYVTARVFPTNQGQGCQVADANTGGFVFLCDVAPGETADLHYVVENLPAQLVTQ